MTQHIDSLGRFYEYKRTGVKLTCVLQSERKMEVLTLLADGLTDRQIGEILGISHRTVGAHLESLKYLLCAKNRIELVANAIRENIIA